VIRIIADPKNQHPDEYIICGKKDTKNCIQYFLTLVLFTFCTCILKYLLCIVVSCLVCNVVVVLRVMLLVVLCTLL